MGRFYEGPAARTTRRSLRKIIPEPENILWYHLRARRLNGIKFRRQYSIGRYVIDFYCPTARLAIEIDGDSHFESTKVRDYDQQRQKYIEACGIRMLRFSNQEVMKNLDGVLEKIIAAVTSPLPA